MHAYQNQNDKKSQPMVVPGSGAKQGMYMSDKRSIQSKAITPEKVVETGHKALQLKTAPVHQAGCNCAGCNTVQRVEKTDLHPVAISDTVQMVQPPRPHVDTSTLKGKVINRAFNYIGEQVKWVEEVQRWMFKCYHCHHWVTEEAVQADHYPIPKAIGGSDDISNLVLSCSACNAANKHNTEKMYTRSQKREDGANRKYAGGAAAQ